MAGLADPLTGLSVDSSAFRQRAPRVELSDDPDIATMQTVREMCRQIDQAAQDPLVVAIAKRAVAQFRGGPLLTPLFPMRLADGRTSVHVRRLVDSCWWWCKHFLRFKHHGEQFEVWSGELGDPRTKLQLLIAPDVLVRMKRMEGDCAIYTMMLCAMLRALGIEFQIVTLAVDPRQPEIFSHVCAWVVYPEGVEWLDASHGSQPGWKVPDRDIHRAWVFDQEGNRMTGRISERRVGFTGLHAYRSRGLAAVCNPTDADYDPAACEGSGGSYVDLTALYPGGIQTTPGTTVYQGQPAYTAPSQSSAQWATFASNLAKMGFSLAQINSIQPGTVVSANGAILRQNPGYSVPVGSTVSGNLGLGGNTMIFIGLGVLALIALPAIMRGGRG